MCEKRHRGARSQRAGAAGGLQSYTHHLGQAILEYMNLVIAAGQTASIPGDISRNVQNHLRFATAAAEHGVQLLVFPELSLTGYELAMASTHVVRPDSAELDPLRRLAEEAQMTIVAGAPLRNERGKLNIRALAMRPDGSVSTYAKEHVHESEMHVFTSGPGGPMLCIAQSNVALAICADASHPEHAAQAAARGANVYAAGVLLDDESYTRKIKLLESYAREHRIAVLMANYSGVSGEYRSAGKSAVWSEDGLVVAASAGAEEELVVASKKNGAWEGTVVAQASSSRC